ncbi:MAG: hypothetical protein ISQ13_04120 [Candidatus Margulisbacteria bacterium]|nr:hypothetical protein [Candidatus Margulisiibacteriota bacterium]
MPNRISRLTTVPPQKSPQKGRQKKVSGNKNKAGAGPEPVKPPASPKLSAQQRPPLLNPQDKNVGINSERLVPSGRPETTRTKKERHTEGPEKQLSVLKTKAGAGTKPVKPPASPKLSDLQRPPLLKTQSQKTTSPKRKRDDTPSEPYEGNSLATLGGIVNTVIKFLGSPFKKRRPDEGGPSIGIGSIFPDKSAPLNQDGTFHLQGGSDEHKPSSDSDRSGGNGWDGFPFQPPHVHEDSAPPQRLGDAVTGTNNGLFSRPLPPVPPSESHSTSSNSTRVTNEIVRIAYSQSKKHVANNAIKQYKESGNRSSVKNGPLYRQALENFKALVKNSKSSSSIEEKKCENKKQISNCSKRTKEINRKISRLTNSEKSDEERAADREAQHIVNVLRAFLAKGHREVSPDNPVYSGDLVRQNLQKKLSDYERAKSKISEEQTRLDIESQLLTLFLKEMNAELKRQYGPGVRVFKK